uniref:Jerky putative n=1 Tax=Albugo laibachii Nc14 TaxID=890382 RepID=F0W8J7_9STRA|nr:jerky putative [Albugo laibachii Nc14]|eukprot:CCA17452.1 jerky putative [Albugo laibachii Nc14]
MDAGVFMSINPLRKKSRSVKFPHFEKALIEFILAKQDVICLSDDLNLKKALRLREQLKINERELQLSNGWLIKFKERNIIRSRTVHGESGSVCETVLKASQTQIQSLIAKFSPDDVFNLDETALYYRLPPNKTLATIQVRGRKKVKERVKLLFAATHAEARIRKCCSSEMQSRHAASRELTLGRKELR